MKKIVHSEFGWTLLKIGLGLLIGILLACALSSCAPDRRIMHTPSKREINRAMSYSTWEYNNSRPQYKAVSVSVRDNVDGPSH